MSDPAEELLAELGLGTAALPASKFPVYVRDLTSSDIISSWRRADYGAKPSVSLIKKLRFPHHTLARLLAEGKGHPECSAITGYAVGSIVMYSRDPAFQELVAYYQEQASQQYLDVHARLASVGTQALEILQDRLTDEPDKITTGQLREIINDTFDRSVAPSKANNNGQGSGQAQGPAIININFKSAPSMLPDEQPRAKLLDVTPEIDK